MIRSSAVSETAIVVLSSARMDVLAPHAVVRTVAEPALAGSHLLWRGGRRATRRRPTHRTVSRALAGLAQLRARLSGLLRRDDGRGRGRGGGGLGERWRPARQAPEEPAGDDEIAGIGEDLEK